MVWAIGEAFSGQEVALRAIGEGRLEVHYCWKKLGIMDFTRQEDTENPGYDILTDRAMSRRPAGHKARLNLTEFVNDVSEQV